MGYSNFFTNYPQYYPQQAVSILSDYAQNHSVVLFNEYGWGGYLALYAPQIKVFIDGRMPHWQDNYGHSLMQDYIQINYFCHLADIDRVFNRYNINTVLIRNSSASNKNKNNILSVKIVNLINTIYPLPPATPRCLLKKFFLKKWQILYEDNNSILMIAPSS